MASNPGNPFSQCLCCIECQDTSKDFQKIMDLKNIGLVIYRHIVEIQDESKGIDDVVIDTKDVFIIQNTKDQEITSAQYIPEIEQNQISCPRCRKIVEHAQRLLHTIPNIDKNVVRGICDHCLMEQKSCNECEQIIQKFISKSKELPEKTKMFIKHWLSKVKHVLKSIDIDDNIKDFETEKTRASSDLYIDRLLIKSPEQSRKSHIKPFFLPQTSFTHKTGLKGQTNDQISLEERQVVDQPADRAQYKHLKEKRLRIIESIPPVPFHSTEELLEGSIEHMQPLTRPKSRYYKIKLDDDDELFGAAYKKKRERHSLRKYHSDESLVTIAEVTSKTDAVIRKDFSYFFPKKTKHVQHPKRFASSSELIKETRDILQDKAEAERKQREIKVLQKLETQEKKKKARAERKYLEDKERSAKVGGVYKRDDESHEMYDEFGKKKLKGVSPSKSTDLNIDKEEAMHKNKGERHAKDDRKEVKESQSKTDRQKEKTEKEKTKREYEEKTRQGKEEKTEKEKPKKEYDEKSRQGKEEKQKDKEQREKSDSRKVNERPYKEQTQKEDKEKFSGQQKEAKDKKGEEKQIQPDKVQKEKKEFGNKSSEMPAKEEKEEKEKIQRDAREGKETGKNISAKAQGEVGLSPEKQRKETKQEPDKKEKEDGKTATKQKDTLGKGDDLRQETEKIQRDAREGKDIIAAQAQQALGLKQQEKKQKEKETKEEKETNQEKETKQEKLKKDKHDSGKSKKSKKDKLSKKELAGEKRAENLSPDEDVAPKSKYLKKKVEQSTEPEKEISEKDLTLEQITARRNSPDDLILRLVKLKQAKLREKSSQKKEIKEMVELKILDKKLRRQHKPHKSHNSTCPFCMRSDLEFELDSLFYEKQVPDFEDIIIGRQVFKHTPAHIEKIMKEQEDRSTIPLLFNAKFIQEDKIDPRPTMRPPPPLLPPSPPEKSPKAEGGGKSPLKPGKQAKASATEVETTKGVVRYTLSDRSFIEKGWTMLPTEKIVRKMNVYRMRPAQPEFDWFEHNKNKGHMTYDTGEILAEFDDNGRGRWFYRNGRLALDYYDAEELNANQRFVIWSSGEPDERGRAQPYTILATFDYLGNGIVFDHSGKIRLKYNQTEGIVLDRKIGPVSHWKWHTLNDPPVLQQVMIDTQMTHKDHKILRLGDGDTDDEKSHPDNEEMLAIEFDNFIREKSKKLTQSFKPFQIKMKALKINENFSLRVMDQASVYLLYRDGTTNLKLNIGMILDHKEIVDTDTAELGEVSNNLERFPARTDSLAGLQKSVAYAQCFERMRSARERRLRLPQAVESADKLTAAASRPMRPPLRSLPSDSSTTVTRTGCSCSRKPTKSNIYYDNRLF